MAQLFIQDASRRWSVFPLADDVYRLAVSASADAAPDETERSCAPPQPLVVESGRLEPLPGRPQLEALLVRAGGTAQTTSGTQPPTSPGSWILLTGAKARSRINGVATPLGISALRHRDQLCLEGGAPIYFSSELLVSVEAYGGSDSPRCPRCTLPIEQDDLHVRCPGCNVLHHQLSDRECWTYAPTCALCDQSSDLDAGYRWSPEGL